MTLNQASSVQVSLTSHLLLLSVSLHSSAILVMHKQNDLYQGHTATQRLFGARTAFLKFGIGYKVSKLNMGTIEKYYFWKN